MINLRFAVITLALLGLVSCSGKDYKTQGYAKLSNTKEFEEEYDVVWKSVIAALGEFKIEEKDSEDGRIKTDWIYSTSNDKYIEYTVNGFPRKRYLQTRFKYLILVEKQVGSVKVTVKPEEEVEALKSDGSFDSWKSVSETDTQRANDMIKSIENKILSRPNALDKS